MAEPMNQRVGVPAADSDEAIAAEARAGRPDRFAELVRRYQHRVLGLVMNYTRRREEALDLCQDIFLATWQSLPRFDVSRSFTNWILKIATHHCYQFLRRTKRPLPPPDPDAGTDLPDPLEVQVRAEAREQVLAAFRRLDEDKRLVVWLYYFLGRSCAEIGEILEISVDLVKIRLFRARREMGEEMGAAGPD